MIEPILQGVVAPFLDSASIPNEDSVLTEFDETNLFTLRRHTGSDGFEEGTRLNVGLRYGWSTDAGADFSATVGRVFRTTTIGSFGAGEGLNGKTSDYVTAWWDVVNWSVVSERFAGLK